MRAEWVPWLIDAQVHRSKPDDVAPLSHNNFLVKKPQCPVST
jgi:hypothetical protein